MTSKRKLFHGGAYLFLLLLAAGCGGINVRQNVSPATFLLSTDPLPAPGDTTLPVVQTAPKVAMLR